MNEIIENFIDILTNKYAEFKGRADRKEFWYYVLVLFVINVAFTILSNILGGVDFLRWVILVIQLLASLALIVPGLAIGVRRMHDIGKGGGWIFINLVPIIGTLWFLFLTIKESEKGENRFG